MAKILLVDDESYVTTTLAAKLDRAGHVTLCAADGEEGLAKASTFLPDLVVTDLQMPLMTGAELATRLAGQHGTRLTPVILLSARGHLVTPDVIGRTRIVRTIQKPFSARDVVAEIDKVLAAGVGSIAA